MSEGAKLMQRVCEESRKRTGNPIIVEKATRAALVARGLRTRRDNSPAFRRADLAKRATALRLRYERIGEAWFACGSVERAAANYARALRYTRLSHRLMGVAS